MSTKLQLGFLVMFITIFTQSLLAQDACTDPGACNFGLSSTAEYTQLDFTSQVTAAQNSYPQGISVGDEVVFSVEFANEGITMANANDFLFDACQSFGGDLINCNAQAWEMASASPYQITYESGYSETGTFTHIIILDGGEEVMDFGDFVDTFVEPDRMYFYDEQNDIYELGFDGNITGVSNDLLSEIAAFDNTTFDIAYYWANWGTWGTYHYDYTTPQNTTQVDLVTSTCYSFDSDNDGVCDFAPAAVPGCTDPLATNYDPLANESDDSCTYDGPVEQLCTDPNACNFGETSSTEYTQLDFTSQVTAAQNSYPQGISVGDEVVFSVEFANEGITMANANDFLFDACQSFGGDLINCNAQAWEMAIASPYQITYESGYSETGTFTHIIILDGGEEVMDFGDFVDTFVEPDRMYFYDEQNDIYELGFDGNITNVSNDLLSEIAAFDNTTFDIAFYWANWGTWGTYHYDYTTPQNNTQVDLVSSTCYSFDSDNDGVCDLAPAPVLGCTNESACNYSSEATSDDGSCIVPVQNCSVCNATNDGLDIVDTDEDGVCDSEEVQGCQDENATNFNSEATDAGDCTYAAVVLGCTYEGASNYNALATIDNNSCVFPSADVLGCTDEGALNYHPAATTDDNSCTYPSTCDSDFNNDGEVNSGDLLVFLGSFGSSCD